MDFRAIKEATGPASNVESESCVKFVTNLAKKGNWLFIYMLSNAASREVSILVDSNDNYFVDWGTIGSVKLSPPIGAVLPFKLWVHTHPSNTAYWSITDQTTLEIAKGILKKAIVLGENGLLSTTLQSQCSSTVATVNSNLQWTEEEVIDWSEFNMDEFSEDILCDIYSYLRFTFGNKKIICDDFYSDGKYW